MVVALREHERRSPRVHRLEDVGRDGPVASVRPCVCAPETPTGRPTVRNARPERRYDRVPADPSVKARRGGCRIPPAATCLDWETAGRRNPGPHRGGPPWSRSTSANRAGAPVRPKSRTRRRSRPVRRVVLPIRLVEVGGKEVARFVQEQRIDASHERLAVLILAREVPANDVVGHRQEPAVLGLGALDPQFLADAADPLVRAGRCVPRLAGLSPLEAARVDVFAAAKQRAKEPNLQLGRRLLIDDR